MIRDLTFQVPHAWVPSSDETWTEPRVAPLRANFVCTRRILDRPTRTGELAAAFLERLDRAKLPNLDIEDERETTALARDQRVAQVTATWDHPHGAVSQLVTMLVRGPVAYTLTSTLLKEDIARLDPFLSQSLSTLRLEPSGDVGFDPPPGWRRGSTRRSSAPDGSGAVSLVKDAEASSPSAARLDAELRGLASKLPGFALVSKRALVWEDSPALGMVHVWTPEGGSPREQQSMMFWSNGAMWTFAASAPREAFAELRPLFASIATTIAPGR